jgi:hypothetical protein
MKKFLILISLIAVFIVSIYFGFLNNAGVLFRVASGLDVPSRMYYFVTEQIYKLSCNNELNEKIKNELISGKNEYLHNLYIHYLGIVGDKESFEAFLKLYSKHQHNTNKSSTINSLIDSMGMSGDKKYTILLKRMLYEYNKLEVQSTKYSIARSIYLLTGLNKHPEVNYEIEITEELNKARNIIISSNERCRSMNEMIALDKLYRPPGW